MSKNFVSEVRRLKDSSLHTGTLKSITVDVESSSTPDVSASEIVTADTEDKGVNDLPSSDVEDSEPQGSGDSIDSNNSDSNTDDLNPSDPNHLKHEDAVDSDLPLSSSSDSENSETVADDDDDSTAPTTTDAALPHPETSQVPSSSSDAPATQKHEEAEPSTSQAKLPDIESIGATAEAKSDVTAEAEAPEVEESAELAPEDQQSAELEAFSVEAHVIEEDADTDFDASSLQDAELTETANSSASRNVQSVQGLKPSSDLEIDALKTELSEALHHEEHLEKRVAELDEQLKQKEKNLSHLKLELGHAQRANVLLSDELAEAKQYILKLTEASKSPETKAQSVTTPSSTAQVQSSQTQPAPEPAEPQSSPARRYSGKPAVVGRTRPAVLTPSRSIGKVEGLPPMSTETMASPSVSSQARRSPQPSQQPSRTPTRFPMQAQTRARQPLNLPERKASAPDAVDDSNLEAQATASQVAAAPNPTAATRKPGAIQRFSRPGLARLGEDIPVVARDTETKEVKPKLSDSELGWFD